jgi:hypothetical protein
MPIQKQQEITDLKKSKLKKSILSSDKKLWPIKIKIKIENKIKKRILPA